MARRDADVVTRGEPRRSASPSRPRFHRPVDASAVPAGDGPAVLPVGAMTAPVSGATEPAWAATDPATAAARTDERPTGASSGGRTADGGRYALASVRGSG